MSAPDTAARRPGEAALTQSSGPAGTERPAPDPRLSHRLRLAAACAVLAALTFIQDPGRVAADTKLDLGVDPAGFLARALDLWEPLGFFGQLQNQAYGYLFPVGPFFVVGDLAGLPAWVVQRLWWSALLIAAFLGTVRLARYLGISSPTARIVAGLAFALAPRMVTEISVVSVEVLPFAIAPWVVIPLASAAEGRRGLRPAAALSGVAVLCASGVNAVATVAILPLGAWWILTRFRGRARVAVGGWWLLSVALACLWWAIPLALLGRYSPPFLDWIESSSVTTLVTTPDTVLRGTSHWVAYVTDTGGPAWPGGFQLVAMPALIMVTGIVAALGLAGLSLRSTRYRAFLIGSLLLGVVLVSLGHLGDVSGFMAEPMRALLDGALAPLRNTHKFDPLIRLPLALGVGFLAQRLLLARHDWQRRVSVTALIALIALGAWPMLTGVLTRDRSYESIPAYWTQVADWLAAADPSGKALIVPGSSFGIYSWGRTQDEPLQPLATTPWAVRDAVPLSSAGNIRWLDGVQERLDSGRGSPGLADALARAGVRYIVLRNDIDARRSEAPRATLLRQALFRSGGFTPVAGFGPALTPYRTETTVVDNGLQDTTAAVEIWAVDSPYAASDARVWLRDADRVLGASGAAESVIDLSDAGVLGSRAVVIAGDEGPLANVSGVVLDRGVTDGYLRTEVGVGRSRDNRSEAMTADQEFRQERRVHDFYPVDPIDRQAVAEFRGGFASASSSGSDPTALRARDPAASPWAAIDGDPLTAWVSGDLEPGVGQWWQVESEEEFAVDRIGVRLVVGGVAGTAPAEILVTTDAGQLAVPVEPTDSRQYLSVPPGPTRHLRLTLTGVVGGGAGEAFGLSDVELPVEIERTIRTTGSSDGGPIVLTARRGESSSCVAVAGQLVCSAALGRAGEERAGISRIVQVAEPTTYRVSVAVRPRPGVGLDSVLEPIFAASPKATASSVATSDPASRPQAVIDGVESTAWIASPLDERPELLITWDEPRQVRGVKLVVSPDLPASRPLTVTAFVGGLQTTSVVTGSGVLTVPPVTTDRLRLRFDNVAAVRSLNPVTGVFTTLPVGVNEVRVLGAQDLLTGPRLFDSVSLPCGFGPEVDIDGEPALETAVDATVTRVLIDDRLSAAPCGGRTVTLDAGDHDITVLATEEFAIESVTLEPVGDDQRWIAPQAPEVLSWDATTRSVAFAAAPEPRLLETSENANPGWSATLDGVKLQPIRVDGWRQGWIVPAGSGGTVSLVFEPAGAYRAGLLAGLAAVIALLALAAVPQRRRTVMTEPDVGRRGQVLLACGGLVAGFLVGGAVGLVVSAASIGVAFALSRARTVVMLGVGAALVATYVRWADPSSVPDLLPGLAALLAIGAITSAAAPDRWWREDGAPKPAEDVR